MQIFSLNNLDGLSGLAGLADRSGVDTRPTLLRVLTDLYIQKPSHSADEERHYVELALRLIEVVDAGTCAAVALRLVGYPAAPQDVVTRLQSFMPRTGHHMAEAASRAASLSDPWLEDDLDIFEPSHLPVPEPENENDMSGIEAEVAEVTAAPLREAIVTTPVPPVFVEMRELFFTAEADERRLILLNLHHVAGADSAPLARGTNVVRYLEQAVLAGRFQEFTTLLQQALGISRLSCSRIIADNMGEPFVVAAKALDMPTDVFQRILMFLNPAIGQSVQRVYELSDLFAEMQLEAALHMVTIIRQADRIDALTTVHKPVHWPDKPPAARDHATHRPRRSELIVTPPSSFGRRRGIARP